MSELLEKIPALSWSFDIRLPYEEKAPSVQRISLSWFSQLGTILQPLSSLRNEEKLEWNHVIALYHAKDFLEALADSRISHLQLRASRTLLAHLIEEVDAVLRAENSEKEFRARKFSISNFWERLNPVLHGELAVQNCYLVWPKRAYDIELLAENGVLIFSEEARAGLSAMEKYDINQAGRCLAFEVPTAACFHMFRATDSVLRRWYKSITGIEPKVKMRSWGAYIKNLRICAANEKILSSLEQIKELHRNPVIHPEAEMSIEEALSFIGIAESVISSMLADIKKQSDQAVSSLLAAASSSELSLP